MKKSTKLLTGGILVALVLAGGFYYYKTGHDAPTSHTAKEFELTAEAKTIQLGNKKFQAWTYDGNAPGPQIRVTEGDKVRITLQNNLSVPTSIHWHGYPVPNAMDGIPGVTQNAVKPGESFTYEFTATTPGTYWYHSHEQSSVQEDKGLYGTFVVLPKNPSVQYDKDVTLVFDEWMTSMDPTEMEMSSSTGMAGMSGMDHNMSGMSGMDHSMSGMDHSNMNMGTAMSHDAMMKQMYDVFTVNGMAENIAPIDVKPGQRVKLRLVNAGFQTHLIHLGNQPFKITDTDGNAIPNPGSVTNQLLAIAPGERYDVEFTATDQSFTIDDHNDSPAAKKIRIPVNVEGGRAQETAADTKTLPTVDLTAYGKQTTPTEHTYNKAYTMVLNNVKNAMGEETYTINDALYPNIPPLTAQKGDWIKVTMKNVGTADHPMHLHGHTFQVLSKNGQPVQSMLLKDTLNVRPGEEYVISFQADNPGIWMFHCHDLHHAAAGMMTELKYDGYKTAITPDQGADHPE